MSLIALAAWIGVMWIPVVAAEEKEEKRRIEDLPGHWQVWIEDEVYPLISTEQRKAFLQLETEAQRRAFADRLWLLWGRQTGIGPTFRTVYADRVNYCRMEFDDLKEDRCRVLLIHGPPDFIHVSRCERVWVPMNIWVWQYVEGLGRDVVVLFYQPYGMGRFEQWTEWDGEKRLYTIEGWNNRATGYSSRFDRPELLCFDGDTTMRLIRAAAAWSRDPQYQRLMYTLRASEKAGPESSSQRFMDFSALLPKRAEPLDFNVNEENRGLRGGKIRMGFELEVASAELGTTKVGDMDVVQVDVVGEISHGAVMVDRFRYLFSVPAAADDLSFLLERFVRPGQYNIRLKVEDVHSKKGSVKAHDFTASIDKAREWVQSTRAPSVAAAGQEISFEEEEEQPIIRLAGPEGEAVSGVCRFEAVTLPEVQKVDFWINGRKVLSKNRPPFSVDLDLGPLPRLTTVMVVAHDGNRVELARDQLAVNLARERFYLRLRPISSAPSADGKVKVVVDVNLPSDVVLERMELFFNDLLLASLYQPPFEAWVKLDRSQEFGYLRAVATLEGGSQAEDIHFVNAPRFGSVVDVTAVELPVTVLDKRGKPVENLKVEDFEVQEDGVPQEISHFSLHRDLPVRMGIVIDTSGSMEETLPEVQRVVMGFLRKLLRPVDRAFIEIFSDQPDILAPFTADFDTLENALLALYADRSTALYDSVITGLFQFSGVRGRNAMIVLTDGEDTASKQSFDSVLNYAQRNGATIYTVGIDLPATKVMVRYHLKKLAEVSGGRAFFLSSDAELNSVYEEIDNELRTQYLLAYTSTSTKEADELRKIEVDVKGKRYKVRTIAGYFPGGL